MRSNPRRQFFLIAFLAAQLAFPLVYKRLQARSSEPIAVNAATALARYGFRFQESAKAAGIDFVHTAATFDPKLRHIMPQVASMGAAVSIVDFDRDGWPDIYVTNSGEGSHNALYRNLGNGTFRDVAEEVGLADVNQPGTGVSTGAVWGDYDNDGYEDVLIYKWGKPELFHNDGGKHFTRVTEQAGLPKWVNANSAIWFDYDHDGKLDLFIGGYYPEDVDLWHLKDTKMMPDSFEYARNGGRKFLFHNLGGGRFEEVSERMGINSRRWALAAVAADLRGTGFPDLFVANDYGVSEVYIKGNNLWMPRAGASGANIQYDNMATAMGVDLGGWSFGAQFGDLNNDGFLDLYAVNGNVSLDRNRSYWYDYSKVAGGNSAIISDAANWPPLDGRSLSGYQQKRVWINDGAGQFKEVAQLVGVTDVYDGRSIALADFENRGALDAVVANERGPLLLYRNTVSPDNRWIEFELEGRSSNRSAIGAQVKVLWNGQEQVQEVSGASGFCAQNQRWLQFGLGKTSSVEKVQIRWPSGQTQTIVAPELNRIHKVVEPS
jgi:hypothetical protein